MTCLLIFRVQSEEGCTVLSLTRVLLWRGLFMNGDSLLWLIALALQFSSACKWRDQQEPLHKFCKVTQSSESDSLLTGGRSSGPGSVRTTTSSSDRSLLDLNSSDGHGNSNGHTPTASEILRRMTATKEQQSLEKFRIGIIDSMGKSCTTRVKASTTILEVKEKLTRRGGCFLFSVCLIP